MFSSKAAHTLSVVPLPESRIAATNSILLEKKPGECLSNGCHGSPFQTQLGARIQKNFPSYNRGWKLDRLYAVEFSMDSMLDLKIDSESSFGTKLNLCF